MESARLAQVHSKYGDLISRLHFNMELFVVRGYQCTQDADTVNLARDTVKVYHKFLPNNLDMICLELSRSNW